MLLKKSVPKRVFQLLLVLAVAASLLFVTACGQKSGQAAQQEEEKSGAAAKDYTDNPWTNGQDLSGTKVNIFGAFVEPGSNLFEKSMEKFEEDTGIEIAYEGSSDFESLITVRVEGGDPPDIAAFPQPGLLQDFVSRDRVQDISGWFEDGFLQEHYDQSWIDIATINGVMAGV